MQYYDKHNYLCCVMSKQHIEVLLVEIEVMNEMLLHCITPYNNTY